MKLIATLFIVLVLMCACTPTPPPVVEDRWLTLEEDQRFRAECEQYMPWGGCVIIPAPQFERLLRDLAKAKAGQGT